MTCSARNRGDASATMFHLRARVHVGYRLARVLVLCACLTRLSHALVLRTCLGDGEMVLIHRCCCCSCFFVVVVVVFDVFVVVVVVVVVVKFRQN